LLEPRVRHELSMGRKVEGKGRSGRALLSLGQKGGLETSPCHGQGTRVWPSLGFVLENDGRTHLVRVAG